VKHHTILRVIAKLLIPYILLFGLYVQFHGDFGPGGGFQAGVILATAFILFALIYGIDNARKAVPPHIIRIGIALGVLIYAGTGFAALFMGGNFLDYSVLAEHAHDGQHIGIMVVEFGVGLTVASVMLSIFFTFAGRERRKD
jgi:multicomponent Na+:H+ antiporter subunit B